MYWAMTLGTQLGSRSRKNVLGPSAAREPLAVMWLLRSRSSPWLVVRWRSWSWSRTGRRLSSRPQLANELFRGFTICIADELPRRLRGCGFINFVLEVSSC
mmetsp:Transcript_3795/g.12571  ORF Transcript_3795/g.12571 Transcript_3795/m.12571 type:complete len:101 (-) Transcript_3795:140-442(-)